MKINKREYERTSLEHNDNIDYVPNERKASKEALICLTCTKKHCNGYCLFFKEERVKK